MSRWEKGIFGTLGVVLVLGLILASVRYLFELSLLILLVVAAGTAFVSWLVGFTIFKPSADQPPNDTWTQAEREAAKHWLLVNIVIITTGGLGILGILIDARRDIGELDAAALRPRYHLSLSLLKSQAQSDQNWFCNTRFHWEPRYEDQASFQKKQDEQSALCTWFTSLSKRLDLVTDEKGKEFDLGDLPATSTYTDMLPLVHNAYAYFDNDRRALLKAEGQARAPDRVIFLLLAPLFLSVALGLAVAKAQFVP